VVESGARRSISPGGRSARGDAVSLAKDMVVESPVLVRMTYRKIHVAQTARGYRLLLPMDGSNVVEEPSVRAWTRAEAIEAVVQEVRDLMEEFNGPADGENLGDESGVMVDFEDPGLNEV